MKTTGVLSLVSAVSLAWASTTLAQPPAPKPGPEHEWLRQREGIWDATMRQPDGSTSKGTITYKMDVGGLWLLSDYEGQFAGQKCQGRGMDGYDQTRQKYVNVWVNSMRTGPTISYGTYDKDNKTLTLAGEAQDPRGQKINITMVDRWEDPNTMVVTISSPTLARGHPLMTITCTRRK
jgi:hypothetical protein